ncbi:MAG: COG3014 family protein [Acidovorax temperans]|uniref:COG3014 family protein n=1 Tax=Acidovorax temperans TaxID=80878 RepID=UPI00391B4E3A
MKTLAHFRPRLLWVLTLSAALTGCASMQSHDKLASDVQSAGRTGGIPAALAQLEASAKSEDDKTALLYNLERGELLRMDRRYEDSTNAFLLADIKVKEWEETAKTNPSKLMGTVGAALISERLKNYEGQDYEKVWLTTRLAMNRVALGDFENARVDIKRTHEREAIIAEFRSKETLAAEEEAKSKGAAAGGKELNGYPVETLNDPEVLALKNGYQNALSHYLAGFMYEVLGESGLAAPGYRKAIELKPETGVLEEGLRGLDNRTSFTWKRRQRMTDVLFVVEAGDAPARKPKAFQLPVPTGRGMVLTSISYPVIEPSKDPLLTTLSAAGTDLKLEKVVDVNVMARRALKDEMPGMVLRGVTRAIAKGVMQNELQKRGGLVGGLIGAVASAATEVADDRMWRMLPGRVYIARGYLPPGEHVVTVNGRALPDPVKIDGQYALVPLRLYENTVLMGDVASLGKLAPVGSVPVEAAAPAAKPAARTATRTTTSKPVANSRTAAPTPAAKN